MLIDPLHPAQSAILELLAQEGSLDVPAIQEGLKTKYDLQPSVPSLYRLVAQMLEHQILVKQKGKLGLNLAWMMHLDEFNKHLRKSAEVQGAFILENGLKEGERKEFTANSLSKLDPVFHHVVLRVLSLTDDSVLLQYNSRPYYELGDPQADVDLYNIILEQGKTSKAVFGNNTFLDKLGVQLFQSPGMTSVINTKTPFPAEGYLLFVCGDYIVEFVMPTILASHFQGIFQTVQNAEDYDAELFADIFHIKARCKLTVRRNKTDAEALREKLLASFA